MKCHVPGGAHSLESLPGHRLPQWPLPSQNPAALTQRQATLHCTPSSQTKASLALSHKPGWGRTGHQPTACQELGSGSRASYGSCTVNCMGFTMYVTCCFSLAAFNILSLCLISVSLINISQCVSTWVNLVRDSALLGLDYFLNFPCWGSFQK